MGKWWAHLASPFDGNEGFLYSDGQIRESSILVATHAPSALNELGQVVGFSVTDGNDARLFYSDDDGRTTDLTRWLRTPFNDVAFADPAQTIG